MVLILANPLILIKFINVRDVNVYINVHLKFG